MATHRTKPKAIKEVTAVQIRVSLTHGSGLTAGDYIVTESTGEQYVMPQAEFEAEYDPIPPPSFSRLTDAQLRPLIDHNDLFDVHKTTLIT